MPLCEEHSKITGAVGDDGFLFQCALCEIDRLRAELTHLRSPVVEKKLFRVECRGMTSGITGAPSGVAYVLADDPTEAYSKLRSRLDSGNIGFLRDRALDKVTLIAETGEVVECGMRLIR